MTDYLRLAVEALPNPGTEGGWDQRLAEGVTTLNGATKGELDGRGSWLGQLFRALDPLPEFGGRTWPHRLVGGGLRKLWLDVVESHASPTLAALTLSGDTIAEDAAIGTVVGFVIGNTDGSTLTLEDQSEPDMFELDGTDLKVAGPLDFETAPSPTVTIRETLAEATNSPRDTEIELTVTDVVEPTYGPELVVNGGFATNTDWTLAGSTAIAGGKLVMSPSDSIANAAVQQITGALAARAYEITIVVDSMTTGTLTGNFQNPGAAAPVITAPGTYTYRVISSGTIAADNFRFGSVASDAVIDSISIREPTALGPELCANGDFASATGWTVGGTGASIAGGVFVAGSSTALKTATRAADDTLVAGGTYRCTFTVLNRVNGSVAASVGNQTGQAATANGTFTMDILTAAANQNLQMRVGNGVTTTAMQIDDFSVKRIY